MKLRACIVVKFTVTGGLFLDIKTENSKTLRRSPEDHRIYLSPLALSLIGDEKGFRLFRCFKVVAICTHKN
jgi:hypothetical protein